MATKKYPGDEFDELTPVSATPIEAIDRRSKIAATDAKATLTTMHIVRDELRAAIQRDEAEHLRIHEDLGDLRRHHEVISERLDNVQGKLVEVSEMSSVANAKLDMIVDDVRAQKTLTIHREKVTMETDAIVERSAIEDDIAERKYRRERTVKLLTILGAAIGTGGVIATLVAGLLGKC